MTRAFAVAIALAGICLPGALGQTPLPRLTNTPHVLQKGFGPNGEFLPNDGGEYCVPTAYTQAFYWLRANGLTRIAPPFSARNALDTDLALAGFFQTTPDGGTDGQTPDNPLPAPLAYLALAGIADVTYVGRGKPTVADIAEFITGNSACVLNIAWVNARTFERTNGHDVTVVATGINAAGQPAAGYVVINNPMSPTTQFLPTYELRDAGRFSGFLAFDGLSKTSTTLAVISGISRVTPATFTQPIAPFFPLNNVLLRASGGSMSVWAPIRGEAAVVKSRASSVVFQPTARGSWTGGTRLVGGELVSRLRTGPAMGRGSITLDGGTLTVAPAGGGTARPVLGAGPARFGFRAGTLALRRGVNARLAAAIGGQLTRGRAGTLLIAPSRGLRELGASEALRLAKRTGSLITAEGDVSPAILGQDAGRGAGDFLRNDPTAGFRARGSGDSGRDIPAGESWETSRLRLSGSDVGGAGTLRLTPFSAAQPVGAIILNGAAVATARLELAAREGVLYASRDGGRITARIEGEGDLVLTGPGRLTLTGDNAFRGATFVNGGELTVENAAGSATGTGVVTVRAPAALSGTGRIDGSVRVEGTLRSREARSLTIGGNAFFRDGSTIGWDFSEAATARLKVEGDLIFESRARAFETLQIRFPAGNGPSVDNPYWARPHQWRLAEVGGKLDVGSLSIQDPRFAVGRFSLAVQGRTLLLVYTPNGPAPGN